MGLKGSKTEQNLKDAFAGESQANRRYPYFAKQGRRGRAERRRGAVPLHRRRRDGHAHGHLEFLEAARAIRPPACRSATARQNLTAAVAGETHEYTDMYPGMAKTARAEGFDEIADWFETLAKAERSHANRYQKALNDALVD